MAMSSVWRKIGQVRRVRCGEILDEEFVFDCVLESDIFVDVLGGLADDVIEEEGESAGTRTHP
jgi:hypothetical protein